MFFSALSVVVVLEEKRVESNCHTMYIKRKPKAAISPLPTACQFIKKPDTPKIEANGEFIIKATMMTIAIAMSILTVEKRSI